MDNHTDLRALLRRLDGEPADALESDTLEFKSWDPRADARRTQSRELRETVVCLANARGGLIVLGVADGKRTRAAALQGVGDLDAGELRRQIYDGTEPHILAEIDELVEPEGRLLAVRVPRGLPPHTTSEGVAKIRVGKECKPLTGSSLAQLFVTRGGRDLTSEPLPGATLRDLDPDQLRLLHQRISREGRRPELDRLGDADLLDALGLRRGSEITFAAVLLLGRAQALARHAAQHELIFTRFRGQTRYEVRRDLKGPLLAVLDAVQGLLEANLQVAVVDPAGFTQLEIPDITWWAAREAVLNALVHRDYFLHQSVHVALHPDRVEITSPGGFIGGVTAENVLRHPPVRRNPLLADVLQAIGLVNRAGLGVDRIYEELLTLGKGLPRYDADEAHVRLVLPTRTQPEFARFVAQERKAGRALELDDLLLIHGATAHGPLDRWRAGALLQLSEEEAAERLVSLRARGYLIAQGRGRGTSYRLARQLSDSLRGRTMTDGELPLDDEALRLRVEAILAERGSLTNAEIRRVSGYSRTQVLRLMQQLRVEGRVAVMGRGRGAHYVPGPKVMLRSSGKDARK